MRAPGTYTISKSRTDTFLLQSDNGRYGAIVIGRRVVEPNPYNRSEVTLQNDGEARRLVDHTTVIDDNTHYDFNR